MDYAASATASLVLYAAYAELGGHWSSRTLIAASLWFFFSLPLFARISNRLQAATETIFASRTAGRLIRVAAQWAYNLALYHVFLATGLVEAQAVQALGGAAGGALLTTIASNGFQFGALALAVRGIGSDHGNVTLAICATVLFTALAIHDVAIARPLFIAAGGAVAMLVIGTGMVRELRRTLKDQEDMS